MEVKPRSYDPSVDNAILLGTGSVFALSGPDEDRPEPAGRLLVPDPEQRGGWREFYVHKLPEEEKPGRRPMGFQRR